MLARLALDRSVGEPDGVITAMLDAPKLPGLNGVPEEGQREAARRETDRLYGKALLERQAQRESNARTYPRRIPIAIRRAEGIYVEDVEGRIYIDCLAGAGALALGHSHPVVVEAVQRVLSESLPWQTLDLMTPVKDRFIEELFASLPDEFVQNAKIQFCGPSGADAVEAALKLVKTATGRRTVLCFHGAYHGMTHGALSVTGELGPKHAMAGLMAEVIFCPIRTIIAARLGKAERPAAACAAGILSMCSMTPAAGSLYPLD